MDGGACWSTVHGVTKSRTQLNHFTSLHFDMDRLLALWPLLLLVSLVTCEVWSLDLYLKRLPCITVYILLQNSIKRPCSTRDLGPRVLLSLYLSLFLADSLECKGWLCNPGTISLFLSFTFLLFTLDRQVLVHYRTLTVYHPFTM